MECVLKNAEETSVALALVWGKWTPVSLMNSSSCRQNCWQHGQLCQQLGRALPPTLTEFTIFILLPRPLLTFGSSCWFSPIPVALRSCFRSVVVWFPHGLPLVQPPQPLWALLLREIPRSPFAEGKRRCRTCNHGRGNRSRGARFQAGTQKLLTKTLQFSAAMLSACKFAPFFYSPHPFFQTS